MAAYPIISKMEQQLTIIYEKGDQGWWVASIPEVPGAISQGKTIAEAKEMVLDALKELSLARMESAKKGLSQSAQIETLPFHLAS
jgi:predicted RNase H-like HicB family nuclease